MALAMRSAAVSSSFLRAQMALSIGLAMLLLLTLTNLGINNVVGDLCAFVQYAALSRENFLYKYIPFLQYTDIFGIFLFFSITFYNLFEYNLNLSVTRNYQNISYIQYNFKRKR